MMRLIWCNGKGKPMNSLISRICICFSILFFGVCSSAIEVPESEERTLTATLNEGNFADNLFVAMNAADSIELLERSQFSAIETVLFLDRVNSTATLQNRVPHTRFFILAVHENVVVFDAVNGYRLSEMQLNENDTERVSPIALAIVNADLRAKGTNQPQVKVKNISPIPAIRAAASFEEVRDAIAPSPKYRSSYIGKL